jgi:L-amino acid N-acyltransferase YncA
MNGPPLLNSLIRPATPGDARLITQLYEEAYRPTDGGSAREHYPFPQILDVDRVAHAVKHQGVYWVVAAESGRVLGSAAALKNIGTAKDRVAEVFGIVVAADARKQGIGGSMLRYLRKALEDQASFILCESRTAVSAGWKVPKANGFLPMGFEPFAHATPAGMEPMLLTGWLPQASLRQRMTRGPLPCSAAGIAKTVLEQWGLNNGSHKGRAAFTPNNPPGGLRASRGDAEGERFLDRFKDEQRHCSGVVGLRRLEGQDIHGDRYDRRYFVVSTGRDGVVAAAKVVIDWTDQRARILHLQTRIAGLQNALFTAILEDLQQVGTRELISIAVDVRADQTHLHAGLAALGFRPTVFYPALVEGAGKRWDALQYTRILKRPMTETIACMESIEWPMANRIVRKVVEQFEPPASMGAAEIAPLFGDETG